MFRQVADARATLANETLTTLRVLEAITEEAAGQAVNSDHRNLRRMAWHLLESRIEMPGRLGISMPDHALVAQGFVADPPATIQETIRVFVRNAHYLDRVLEGWDDSVLEQEDDMYGERWSRGKSLFILLAHEIHHRGQMTVLMRQAGLVVPEVYGPNKEGWAAFGMEAPKV